MQKVLSGYVERREVPGLVALVSRHGDLHVETTGRFLCIKCYPTVKMITLLLILM